MGVTEWFRRLTGGSRSSGSGTGEVRDRPGRGRAGAGREGSHAKHGGSGSERSRPGRPQPTGRPGRQADPDPARPVLGLSAGTKGAWVGALLEASGHGTPHVVVGQSIEDVLAQTGPVAVVAVDVPIGLADDSRREADVQTRRFVGAQASTIVTTPVREAIYADTFQAASSVNRERLGSGISQQAYGLRRQIIEVDAWLRQDLPHRVVEAHPEASLAMMAGTPMASRRGSREGTHERREVLAGNGIYVPTTMPHGTSAEQLTSACAAAWTAHRVKTGSARSFPEQPQTFSDGIPAAIHV